MMVVETESIDGVTSLEGISEFTVNMEQVVGSEENQS